MNGRLSEVEENGKINFITWIKIIGLDFYWYRFINLFSITVGKIIWQMQL